MIAGCAGGGGGPAPGTGQRAGFGTGPGRHGREERQDAHRTGPCTCSPATWPLRSKRRACRGDRSQLCAGLRPDGAGAWLLNDMAPRPRPPFEARHPTGAGRPADRQRLRLVSLPERARAGGLQVFLCGRRNPLYKTPTKPYTNAGLCYLRIKDDKRPRRISSACRDIDGSNAQAIYHLSNLAYKRGDFQRQEISWRTAPPDGAQCRIALAGRAHRAQDRRPPGRSGYASQLRRRFAGTPEHQALMQGNYE
jgi:hypothetical protein